MSTWVSALHVPMPDVARCTNTVCRLNVSSRLAVGDSPIALPIALPIVLLILHQLKLAYLLSLSSRSVLSSSLHSPSTSRAASVSPVLVRSLCSPSFDVDKSLRDLADEVSHVPYPTIPSSRLAISRFTATAS